MTRPIVALVALALTAPGCASLSCTEVGCVDSFQWSAPLPAAITYDGARSLDVRACRNDACAVVGLDELDPGGEPPPGGGLGVPLADASGAPTGAMVTLLRQTDGTYRITLTWSPPGAADGDRYLVEVTDVTGAVVIGLAEQEVTYTLSRPNGPSCPPECRTVAIDGSTLGAF